VAETKHREVRTWYETNLNGVIGEGNDWGENGGELGPVAGTQDGRDGFEIMNIWMTYTITP
jgi:hypothetical protein